MKTILSILLSISLLSCSKETLKPADWVELNQDGELITVIGHIATPLTYDFEFRIVVDLCGRKQEYNVVVKKGETVGEKRYQDNCKTGRWDVRYAGILQS